LQWSMAAILRTFGIKKSKHKSESCIAFVSHFYGLICGDMSAELPEEWSDCKAPVIEGITFYCKYLGNTVIEEPSSEVLTAEAIKRIIQMVSSYLVFRGFVFMTCGLTLRPKRVERN
jgi:hypothetical protein